MRVHARLPPGLEMSTVRSDLVRVAAEFGMEWNLVDQAARARILVLASRAGHCVNDLLYRWHTGWLPADIVAVVSNHGTLRPHVDAFDVPYHHLPVDPEHRDEQEAALLEVVAQHRADVVVLARYMQILSPRLCDELAGRAINIHHSFLPSFAGAQPYRQAHGASCKLSQASRCESCPGRYRRVPPHQARQVGVRDRDTGAHLTRFAWTKIVRHDLVKGRASPDDPALAEYWARRRRKTRDDTPPIGHHRTHLLKKQNGRCPICQGLLLHATDPPRSPEEWEQWAAATRKAITKNAITTTTTTTTTGSSTGEKHQRLVHEHCRRRHRPRGNPAKPAPRTPQRLA